MNIRKKIFLGCIIIAFILFLAGVVIVFEMKRIRSSVSVALFENVASMNAAHRMQYLIGQQNIVVLNYHSVENDSILTTFRDNIANYHSAYNEAKNTITIEGEKAIIDSIDMYYSQYNEIVNLLTTTNIDKKSLYALHFPRLSEIYNRISKSINELFLINQQMVEKNSLLIDQNYYRMIMPAIVAIVAGIVLIFLFYYFMNIYVIKPILKITKGVNAFSATRVPYKVEIETQDEIAELNTELKKLTELAKKYEKEQKQ